MQFEVGFGNWVETDALLVLLLNIFGYGGLEYEADKGKAYRGNMSFILELEMGV